MRVFALNLHACKGIGAAVLVSICAALPAIAQEVRAEPREDVHVRREPRTDLLQGTFNGSVKNVFGDRLDHSPQKELLMLPPPPAKRQPKENFAVPRQPTQQHPQKAEELAAPDVADSQPVQAEEQLGLREKLLREFGDPAMPQPVKGIDTAPKPFRAMLAALQAGDEKLAAEYAINYVRYQRDLNNAIERANALEHMAMVREDMLPPGAADDPEYRQYDWVMDLKLDEKRPGPEKITDEDEWKELDQRARELIAKVKEQQHDLFNNRRPGTPLANELNEQEERMKARSLLGRRPPRDPQGKVNVLFFLEPNDTDALAVAGDIELLFKRTQRDKAFNFAAFTIQPASKLQVNRFKETTHVTFPIGPGLSLAREMRITKSPTVIFISPATGRTHIEEGLRNFYYYDEVVNLMQGR